MDSCGKVRIFFLKRLMDQFSALTNQNEESLSVSKHIWFTSVSIISIIVELINLPFFN